MDSRSSAEYLIAVVGAVLLFALYPLWFRIAFDICRRAKAARPAALLVAAALGVSWYLLVLDIFLFRTTILVFWVLVLVLVGIFAYLFLNRV